MASKRTTIMSMASPACGSDQASPNTTFVQADPSNFREVVQKLTGAPDNPAVQKQPVTLPNRASIDRAPKRPAFRLHERRHATKKLELDLKGAKPSASAQIFRPRCFTSFGSDLIMASPVSTLEFLARGSPGTPVSPCSEEEKAIAEKGFYLHPSPMNTPRGAEPPELLPLFPLRSPRDTGNNDSLSCSSTSS